MQPVTMRIVGEYWDTHVYSGVLYLFCRDGSIAAYNWDRLIQEWPVDAGLRFGLDLSFRRNDYLYKPAVRLMLEDEEIATSIRHRFERLAQQPLVVEPDTLQKYLISVQDNQFEFPHTAAEIYRNELYVGGRSGILRAGVGRGTKNAISTRIYEEWDGPVAAMKASYQALAVAAGSEGLFQVPAKPDQRSWLYTESPDVPTLHLSSRHCMDCNWAYHSIFGSSQLSGGVFAEFLRQDTRPYMDRELSNVVEAADLFHADGFSWGVGDKFYSAENGTIRVIRYNPWAKNESPFEPAGELRLRPWKGNIVSAGAAAFGVVIECDNALVVWRSDGRTNTFRGEPVTWKVYPRSTYYENQLHLVHDQNLDIVAFTHDYALDQNAKPLGTKQRAARD